MNKNLFTWYEFKGRSIRLKTSKAEFFFEKGHVFGVRERGNKIYITDIEAKSTVAVDEFTANRMIDNSKSVNLVIGGKSLKTADGGRNKRDPSDLKMDSGLFRRAKYDVKDKTLTVQFKNGNIWQYSKVSLEDALAFEASTSQGSYYNKEIKPKYKGEQMESFASACDTVEYDPTDPNVPEVNPHAQGTSARSDSETSSVVVDLVTYNAPLVRDSGLAQLPKVGDLCVWNIQGQDITAYVTSVKTGLDSVDQWYCFDLLMPCAGTMSRTNGLGLKLCNVDSSRYKETVKKL